MKRLFDDVTGTYTPEAEEFDSRLNRALMPIVAELTRSDYDIRDIQNILLSVATSIGLEIVLKRQWAIQMPVCAAAHSYCNDNMTVCSSTELCSKNGCQRLGENE